MTHHHALQQTGPDSYCLGFRPYMKASALINTEKATRKFVVLTVVTVGFRTGEKQLTEAK